MLLERDGSFYVVKAAISFHFSSFIGFDLEGFSGLKNSRFILDETKKVFCKKAGQLDKMALLIASTEKAGFQCPKSSFFLMYEGIYVPWFLSCSDHIFKFFLSNNEV